MAEVRRAAGFVVYKVFEKRVLYLLLQASYKPFHWTPPKGHLEAGESDMDAAFRETQEEAGLSKDQLKVYENITKTLKYMANGKPKSVVYWLAELTDKSGEVKLSSEHQALKWAELPEALELSVYPEMKDLLNEFTTKLKNT